MQFAQLSDAVDVSGSRPAIYLKPFVGNWNNANADTSGIESLNITDADGLLKVACNAIGNDTSIDWAVVNAKPFSSSPTSGVAAGFKCEFEFGFKSVRLFGMLMKGLLVLAQIHSFHDDSGRQDYFAREYYSRTVNE